MPAIVAETNRAELPVANELAHSGGMNPQHGGDFLGTDEAPVRRIGSHRFLLVRGHRSLFRLLRWRVCAFPFDPMRLVQSPPQMTESVDQRFHALEVVLEREAARGYYSTHEERAAVLGISRFALRRLQLRWWSSFDERRCELCRKPIPWHATARRRFCLGSGCRAKAWRLRQPS
jgi:hypothetical protein